MQTLHNLCNASPVNTPAIFKKRLEIVRFASQTPGNKLERPPIPISSATSKKRRGVQCDEKKRFCGAYIKGVMRRQHNSDAATIQSKNLPTPHGLPRAIQSLIDMHGPSCEEDAVAGNAAVTSSAHQQNAAVNGSQKDPWMKIFNMQTSSNVTASEFPEHEVLENVCLLYTSPSPRDS